MRIFTTSFIVGVLGMVMLFVAPPSGPAFAQSATAYCAGGAGHQSAVATPAALVPIVAKAFEIDADLAQSSTYVRCDGRRLMACAVGANLDCGKADTRRSLPGATAFCRNNPGSSDIPMVATGHATIYDWHCVGRRAVAGKIMTPVDRHGFIAANWKAVE
jgi:hypothetical protein